MRVTILQFPASNCNDDAVHGIKRVLAFPVKTRNFVRWGRPCTLDKMSTLINLYF
jgi:hypothetical protein